MTYEAFSNSFTLDRKQLGIITFISCQMA